jgi:hypothetical protein
LQPLQTRTKYFFACLFLFKLICFSTSGFYLISGTVSDSTLTLTNGTYSNGLRYRASFSSCLSALGVTKSNSATLCIGLKPNVTVHPGSQLVANPSTATFSAIATFSPLASQVGWDVFAGGNWISVDSNPQYTISRSAFTVSPVTTSLNFTADFPGFQLVRARFTNCVGTAYSINGTFTLCLGANPTITQDLPTSVVKVLFDLCDSMKKKTNKQNLQGSGSMTLQVSATASPAMESIVWQVSTNSGLNWTNIVNNSNPYLVQHVNPFSNSVTSSLTFTTSSTFNNYKFRVLLSNCFGLSTTATMTLCSGDVTFSPNVPLKSVTDRQNVTVFVVRTTNQNPPITAAQWEISNDAGVTYVHQLVSDATYTLSGSFSNMTLSFVSIFPTVGRWYRVRYTTCLGTNFSAVGKLTVNCVASQAPLITAQPPVFVSTIENSAVTISATAQELRSLAPNLAVRWEFSRDLGRTWLPLNNSLANATIFVSPQVNYTELTITPPLNLDGYRFRASFKNCWSAWTVSTSTTLSVSCNSALCPPVIVTQPVFQTLRVNGIASFNAAAIGPPGITSFLWEISRDAGVTWVRKKDMFFRS